jgi:hypothetical protein
MESVANRETKLSAPQIVRVEPPTGHYRALRETKGYVETSK